MATSTTSFTSSKSCLRHPQRSTFRVCAYSLPSSRQWSISAFVCVQGSHSAPHALSGEEHCSVSRWLVCTLAFFGRILHLRSVPSVCHRCPCVQLVRDTGIPIPISNVLFFSLFLWATFNFVQCLELIHPSLETRPFGSLRSCPSHPLSISLRSEPIIWSSEPLRLAH